MSSLSGDAAYRGRFFDGVSAKSRDVTLIDRGNAFAIVETSTGAEVAVWPIYRMRALPQPGAGGRLTLVLQDSVHDPDTYSDARLTVEDPATARRVRDRCPELDKKPAFGWRAARPYLLWSGAAAASLAFLFWFGIPMLAGFLVQVIPDRAQIALGEIVENQIIELFARSTGQSRDTLICRQGGGQEALDALMARFTAEAPVHVPVTITVLNVEQVNALALPGGRILVFNGLVDFAGHPNALAGVLAHELGHIAERHPLRGTLEKGAAGALIGLLLGDIAGGAIIAAGVEYATSAAYSREMEAQADDYAVAAMNRQGWTVGPFGAFFERLAKENPESGGVMAMLSTHPASEDRRRTIAAAEKAGGTTAVTEAGWTAIGGICEPPAPSPTPD